MASETPSTSSQTQPKDAFAFVAARALKVIVRKRSADHADEATLTAYFRDMLFDQDYVGHDAVAEVLDDEGVTPEYVLDILIPDIARNIGIDWQMDRMSFATVTVISARLQALAWKFIEPYRDSADQRMDAPRILVVTPENETHTLGAVIAVGGFARLGCQVKAAFSETNLTVQSLAKTGNFDLVALSAAPSSNLPAIAKLITTLKRSKNAPSIALGGSIVAISPGAAATLGADITTSDADETLTYLRAEGKIAATESRGGERPALKIV